MRKTGRGRARKPIGLLLYACAHGHGLAEAGAKKPAPWTSVCSVDPVTRPTWRAWWAGASTHTHAQRRAALHPRRARSLSLSRRAGALLPAFRSPFCPCRAGPGTSAPRPPRPWRPRCSGRARRGAWSCPCGMEGWGGEARAGGVSLLASARRFLMRGEWRSLAIALAPIAPPHAPHPARPGVSPPHALESLAPDGGRDGGGGGHSVPFLMREKRERARCCFFAHEGRGARGRRGRVRECARVLGSEGPCGEPQKERLCAAVPLGTHRGVRARER